MTNHKTDELSNIDSHIKTILELQKKADSLVKKLANTMLEIEELLLVKDKADE